MLKVWRRFRYLIRQRRTENGLAEEMESTGPHQLTRHLYCEWSCQAAKRPHSVLPEDRHQAMCFVERRGAHVRT
jgi:hypothetical protein